MYIEGRAFKQEAPLLKRAAENGWPVEAEFAEAGTDWQPLRIQFLANTVDAGSQTFPFFLALSNQYLE